MINTYGLYDTNTKGKIKIHFRLPLFIMEALKGFLYVYKSMASTSGFPKEINICICKHKILETIIKVGNTIRLFFLAYIDNPDQNYSGNGDKEIMLQGPPPYADFYRVYIVCTAMWLYTGMQLSSSSNENVGARSMYLRQG